MQCDALMFVYTEGIYNGIVFSHKEGNPHICNNVDKPSGIMLGEISQTQKGKYCMISFLCEKKSQTHRIRGKIGGCQGLREGEMGLLLFSCQAMSDSMTPWTVPCQGLLSMGDTI